jgi:hypothetical protein
MYSFDAHYDEEGAARAERTFFVRSIRELRSWLTFGPPAFLSLLAVAGVMTGASGAFLLSSGGLLVASLLLPVFLYFERPRAAARLARRHPVRRISMTVETFSVSVGERETVVPWARVSHIWPAPGYTLLVVGKLSAVSIPVASLPAGAHEFMRKAAKHAA